MHPGTGVEGELATICEPAAEENHGVVPHAYNQVIESVVKTSVSRNL